MPAVPRRRSRPAGLALLSDLRPEQIADATIPITPHSEQSLHALLTGIGTEIDVRRRATLADRLIAERIESAPVGPDLVLANAVLDELTRGVRAPDSRVDKVWHSPADTPSGPAGMVLIVDFTLGGQQFQGLNGGPDFSFNESVSFVIECEDQAEVNRLWDTPTADGGEPGPCGWLKDRYGLSWQIVPKALNDMIEDPDTEAARRAMEAMLTMGKLDVAELRRAFERTSAPGPA